MYEVRTVHVNIGIYQIKTENAKMCRNNEMNTFKSGLDAFHEVLIQTIHRDDHS